jgi:membrane protease YdiL (CAAX protease family)
MKNNIFWNTEQNRLRTGWRLLIQLILFILVLLGESIFIEVFGTGWLSIILANLIYLAGGLSLSWLMARFIDRRLYADFGFHLDRKWWLDFGFGLMLGALMITSVLLSMRAVGWLTIAQTATTNWRLPFSLVFFLRVVTFTIVAINEELTFRGYQLKNLAEGFTNKTINSQGAIVLAFLFSSAIFGLAHAANPNSTTVSTLNIIMAGLVIGLPYLLTGELGLSIGLHLTWNFFQGPVYGFAVSGDSPPTHLFSIQQTGPILWTGGAFGPEGGLIALLWLIVGCGLILLWIKWLRKHISLYAPLASYTPRHNNR